MFASPQAMSPPVTPFRRSRVTEERSSHHLGVAPPWPTQVVPLLMSSARRRNPHHMAGADAPVGACKGREHPTAAGPPPEQEPTDVPTAAVQR
jgi:hypothetical protein